MFHDVKRTKKQRKRRIKEQGYFHRHARSMAKTSDLNGHLMADKRGGVRQYCPFRVAFSLSLSHVKFQAVPQYLLSSALPYCVLVDGVREISVEVNL